MHLDQRGHPLHTRSLTVSVTQREAGHLDCQASLLDLRKRGFVPVGGDLQSSGIVHQMHLAGIIDATTGTVEALEATQPSVAFEASATTGGESCRDVIGNVAGLAGTQLGEAWPPQVASEIGGPRGCYHLVTLAHLLGSTATWALGRERTLRPDAPARPAGQRVFRRDVIIDGAADQQGHVTLALQLIDLHFSDADGMVPAMTRFAESLEVQILATVELRTMTLGAITVADRRCPVDEVATAAWRSRLDVQERLVGMPALRGYGARVRELFGDAADDRPILDALLQLAPTLIQVFATISDAWPAAAAREGWLVGMSGYADSCYMWRRGGGLDRARTPADPDRSY